MSQHRSRTDPRRAATRLALIEAAELLFAEHGVDGVSTRQLGAAIGSANTNVVAYHFGSKEALLVEVMRYRVPALEARRAELLEEVRRRAPELTLTDVLNVLCRPFFEQTDASGRHTYAAFLSGLARSNRWDVREALRIDYPITGELADLALAALPQAAMARAYDRLLIAVGIVLTSLQIVDQKPRSSEEAEAIFVDALSMAEGALTAPGR